MFGAAIVCGTFSGQDAVVSSPQHSLGAQPAVSTNPLGAADDFRYLRSTLEYETPSCLTTPVYAKIDITQTVSPPLPSKFDWKKGPSIRAEPPNDLLRM